MTMNTDDGELLKMKRNRTLSGGEGQSGRLKRERGGKEGGRREEGEKKGGRGDGERERK